MHRQPAGQQQVDDGDGHREPRGRLGALEVRRVHRQMAQPAQRQRQGRGPAQDGPQHTGHRIARLAGSFVRGGPARTALRRRARGPLGPRGTAGRLVHRGFALRAVQRLSVAAQGADVGVEDVHGRGALRFEGITGATGTARATEATGAGRELLDEAVDIGAAVSRPAEQLDQLGYLLHGSVDGHRAQGLMARFRSVRGGSEHVEERGDLAHRPGNDRHTQGFVAGVGHVATALEPFHQGGDFLQGPMGDCLPQKCAGRVFLRGHGRKVLAGFCRGQFGVAPTKSWFG